MVKNNLKVNVVAALLLLTGALSMSSAYAFTPSDFGGVVVSPPFGSLVSGGEAGTNYDTFGVDFSYGGVEGVFNDPPLAFTGVDSFGIVDLLSPVDGRIVVLGTSNQGVTNHFYAEAGFASAGALLLSVYDTSHNLIGSAFNGDPTGATGRTTFEINTPGIAYFSITDPGLDSYGVTEIVLGTISPVPEPETYAMLLAGLGLLGFMARHRKESAS